MPLTEEILRLKYEAVGQGEVARAKAELALLDGEVKRLKADFDAGRITAQQYAASLDMVGKKAATAQGSIDGWQQPLAKASGGIGQFANSLSMLSVMYDDIIYGSKNVANNLIGIGMMSPHPAMKVLFSVGGLLVSVFHKQIDAAFGLGNAYKKAGDEAAEAAAKMETFGERLAESMRPDSASVQRLGSDLAKTIDDLSSREEGGLFAALLGTKGADQRIERLKEKAAQARDIAERGDFISRRSALKREQEFLDQIQAIRVANEKATRAELDKLVADAARGDEGARSRLEDLAIQAGAEELRDALQRLGPQFAQAEAKAGAFVDEIERGIEANKKLADQLEEAGRANEEFTKEVVRQADERVEAARREAEEKARIREAEQNADADVNANAFRDALSPGIRSTMSGAMAQGATREQAGQMAFTQTFGRMRAAGLGDVQAANAAARLVEEQSGMLEQLVANMDALLGLFVAQNRQGTMARRRAAIQANEIRRQQLMMQAQNPFLNNRPDGL